jgi:hypothetical protein
MLRKDTKKIHGEVAVNLHTVLDIDNSISMSEIILVRHTIWIESKIEV